MKLQRKTIAKVIAAAFVFNLVVMGAGAWFAYQEAPPIPDRIVGPDGQAIVTGEDIRDGKKTFQRNGLMNHGSILGNGAYYGEDYTADALELKTQYMKEYYAQERHGAEYKALDTGERASIDAAVKEELDVTGSEGPIQYSEAELYAHQQVREEYVERYNEGSAERGIPEGMIESEEEAREFADFAMWTAWISHADRPGTDHSYTNEWPYVPEAGNAPTGSAMTWSVISMVLLVAGAGAGVYLYRSVELPEPSTEGIDVPHPDEIDLTLSQRSEERR